MIIMEHNMLGEFQFFEAYTINVTSKRSKVYKESVHADKSYINCARCHNIAYTITRPQTLLAIYISVETNTISISPFKVTK